jgi:hypothetical protein
MASKKRFIPRRLDRYLAKLFIHVSSIEVYKLQQEDISPDIHQHASSG